MDYTKSSSSSVIIALVLSVFIVIIEDVSCVRQNRFNSTKEMESLGNEDLVKSLPGQPLVKFRHYAGHVTVNESNGRALFYWFYEAMDLPEDKPLVLWLNGGPGCSSVGYGATQEIGPFLVDNTGNALKFNPYAWNKEANLLFVESPVGVGFSYSNTTSDYKNLGDDFTAKDAYTFLHKWFERFPSYKERTFYIAGESYAGKYVPELAEVIYDNNNNKNSSLRINLRGFLLGNPETSDAEDWQGFTDYAWSHAVISDETHAVIRRTCNFSDKDTWNNVECKQAVDETLKQYEEIERYSLYTDVCIVNGSIGSDDAKATQFQIKHSSTMIPRLMTGYDPCMDNYAKIYYNKPDVQKALHASDGVNLTNWSICKHRSLSFVFVDDETGLSDRCFVTFVSIFPSCSMEIYGNWSYSKKSVLPIYEKLIAAGLRIWVYSGDTDGRVPVLGTRYWLGAWRPWYHEKQVSRWIQEYRGLTFATFKGAGHAVPCFKPSSSLAFFSAFLNGVTPPTTRSRS